MVFKSPTGQGDEYFQVPKLMLIVYLLNQRNLVSICTSSSIPITLTIRLYQNELWISRK